MINTISDAFGRPHKKNGSERLPFSIKHTLEKTRSSLSVQELKLLVAAMVD